MPLYGHELGEDIDPYQAGLGYAVDLEGRVFPGSAALAKLRDDAKLPQRVGLILSGKRVAREGYSVYHGDSLVGRVTSGTFSPTLEAPIAMGYVSRDCVSQDGANPATELTIDIRGHRETARTVQLPFYRRTS